MSNATSWMVTIDVPEERIKDILVSAIESPPGEHWCKLTDYCQHPNLDMFDSFLLNNTGWMEFTELDPDTGELTKVHRLNWFGDHHSIQSGIKAMAEKYPHHFADWMSEQDDAITAYVFLQCCLLGEVVYG